MMVTLLNSFLTLNLLLILSWGVFKIFRLFKASQRLKLQYMTLGLVLATVIIQPLIPKHDYVIPALKVWEGKVPTEDILRPEVVTSSFVTISSDVSAIRVETSILFKVVFSLVAIVFIFGLYKLIKELILLNQIEKKSFLFRRNKHIQILLNEQIDIPFSYRRGGKLMTVIPAAMLGVKRDFDAAVFHEFQHHRQGDTSWIYLLLTLKNLCFFNPFCHWFEKEILETQEFACDETLLELHKVTSDDYIGCLIKVAQTAVLAKTEPECATGFCFGREPNILKRRIETMNSQNFMPTRKWSFNVLTIFIVLTMAFSAWASRNLVQDRKITMEEARELIKNQGEFPLIVNEDVLTQLNKYLGTPEGRAFIKESLSRKTEFDSVLNERVAHYKTPVDLNAIPVVESGYINRTSSGRIRAAGLWMFIPATARRYGMKVNKEVDERLNVKKETDAAHRYLLANKHTFDDWHLALLAYNVGEGTVQKGIKKFQTRNAWELIEKGVEGDKDYLPSVMAAMIIMRNPTLLEN